MSRITVSIVTAIGLSLGAPELSSAQQSDGHHLLGVSLGQVHDTDLFKFFGFTEESRSTQPDGQAAVRYQPGGEFGAMVKLTLVERRDVITQATLVVHRSFLDHGVNGLFARDLVGSFVSTAPPSADAGDSYALSTLIKQGGGDLVATMLGDANPTSLALEAVTGRAAGSTLEWSQSTMVMRNDRGTDGVEVLTVDALASADFYSTVGTVHDDPESVLNAVFEAARNRDPSQLHGLCDPTSENDGDTQDVCDLTAESAQWEEFVQYFESGRITGAAKFGTKDGVRVAHVPFGFLGPDADQTETMTLVEHDGRWYLASF